MEQIAVAVIAATPPLAGVAWAVFRELKKIGRSVDGELDKKFDRLHGCIGELSADLRDVKADVRELKATQRVHDAWHNGDGR